MLMSSTVQSSERLFILSSITKLVPGHAGAVVVSGSHGGVYPAALAAKAGLRGAIFSDAGVGLESAGIAGVKLLDEVELAGAAADYMSARIGDGADIYARGVVSDVNAAAARLGCRVGEPVSLCAAKMMSGEPCARPLPVIVEGRALLRAAAPQIWGIDSNSLAAGDDAGALIVSGSHGALLGGDRASAIKPEVRAAAFNDAGIGVDSAGTTRLPALDRRRIAAVTVSAASARIGDARSSWETGIISACNATAAAAGAREGMRLKLFFSQLAARLADSLAGAGL
jgi:hypothetical protein